VILDPRLAASAPRRVAATAGIDAVSHAVESHVTKKGNPVSRMLSREAWSLLAGSLEKSLSSPDDLEAVGNTLLGAHLAGAAIEASMLGAAHSCANPLTAHFGIVHGVAVGLMLPHVVRFNAEAVGELYRDLYSGNLAARIEDLRAAADLPAHLADCGVDAPSLPALADEASRQWTATFNPRPVDAASLLSLYEAAF
jgi:alcohol dehydrogenase